MLLHQKKENLLFNPIESANINLQQALGQKSHLIEAGTTKRINELK